MRIFGEVIKFVLVFVYLLAFKVEAQNETGIVREVTDNKPEQSALTDYIKKCEDNIQAACYAGWNSQLNIIKMKKVNEDSEETLYPEYINTLTEVCKNNNFVFCATGLEGLAAGLKNALVAIQFKETQLTKDNTIKSDEEKSSLKRLKQELDFDKNSYRVALDTYSTEMRSLCQKTFTLNVNPLSCLNYFESNKEEAIKLVKLYENDCITKKDVHSCGQELKAVVRFKLNDQFSKTLIKSYENICLENKDFKICTDGLSAALELGMDNDFANIVCGKDSIIDQLSPCQKRIQIKKKIETDALEKKHQEEQYISIGLKAYVGLEILIIALILVLRTRCPKCNTNFAFQKRVLTLVNENDENIETEEDQSISALPEETKTIYECRNCHYVKE